MAWFATARLLKLRGSVPISLETVTEFESSVAREVKQLVATFALQQKREITTTCKSLDIKVAVFGLEDEVCAGLAGFPRMQRICQGCPVSWIRSMTRFEDAQ